MATVNKTSVRVITRLIEMGITTEKEVVALELKDALAIPGITVADLHAVCELRRQSNRENCLSSLLKQARTRKRRNEYDVGIC